MSLQDIVHWIEATQFSTTVKEIFWVVPTVQSIHIIAITFVFTAAVVLSLRSWAVVGVDWSPALWGKRLFPGLWTALVVLALTGSILISGEPERELMNPYFQFKMASLVVAIILTLVLARRFSSGSDAVVQSGSTRLLATVTIVVWVAIICAGRWIAYG
jgi:hypothetical protein